MDVLTDILLSAGLHSTILTRHAFYSSWGTWLPCNKSMGFHFVSHGEIYVRAPRFKTSLRLQKGDIVLLNRGFYHEIATDNKVKARPLSEQMKAMKANAGKAPVAALISGVYQFQTEPIHPFFAELPDYIILRAHEIPANSPLYIAQQLLSAELSENQQGSDAVIKGLLDVAFNYILRNWLNRETGQKHSWSVALKDKHLQNAIKSIHAEPAKEWSLEKLASISGLSRAAFAQKFKRMTGDSPAHYLAKVRVQRAMDLLRSTDLSLEVIADRIGYGDPFVFSKAFKRIQGVSPRDFKKGLESDSVVGSS